MKKFFIGDNIVFIIRVVSGAAYCLLSIHKQISFHKNDSLIPIAILRVVLSIPY